jgi:hypothetical protein
MSIVEDYGAIAKRLRELQSATPKDAQQITELEKWRDAAFDTARSYVQRRKMEIVRRRILPRRIYPTD